MEEIDLKKSCNIGLFCWTCVFLLCSSVFVYGIYFVIKNLVNHTHDKDIFYAIFGVIIFPVLANGAFNNVITLLRFYNLKIEVLRTKLILRTETKECEIPMTEDTNVVYWRDGWLISWPSEKSQSIILLPRCLLGKYFLELCFYFQENTNYIPSRGIVERGGGIPSIGEWSPDYYQPNADYDAAEKEEEKLLESLDIYKYSRLKYINWPS